MKIDKNIWLEKNKKILLLIATSCCYNINIYGATTLIKIKTVIDSDSALYDNRLNAA